MAAGFVFSDVSAYNFARFGFSSEASLSGLTNHFQRLAQATPG
jgi:hypothetical protein